MAKKRTRRGNGSRAIRDSTGGKPAERDLRGLEEEWRSLVENIPDIIMTVDADGTILFTNRTVPGLTVEKVTGTSVYDYLPPEHHDTLRKPLERVFQSGKPFSYEIAGAGPFGHTSWYLSRIGPIVRDGRVVAAALMTTDITERKRAEEELRASEERFRSTLDNMIEGALIVAFDWRYLYANDAVSRHTSRRKEELLGHTMMEMHPGIENTPEFAHVRRSMEERVAHQMEWRYAYPDGSTAWFDVSIQPVPEGVFMLFLNVTERKRAEEALRTSEERYRDLAENLNDAVFEFDASGRITFAGSGMEEVTGYGAPELIGRPFIDLVHPDDLEGVTDKVRRRPFGDREPNEYRLVTKSGEARWVRSLGGPVFDGSRVVAFRAALTDITERKRAEDVLRESEERYRELVEDINDVIYEVNAGGGLIYVSPVVREVGGYSPSEMIGRSFTDFLHPDDVSRAMESHRRGVAGDPQPDELRFLSKSGEVHWMRSFGRPIREGDRIVGFRGVLTDITERKQAEEALRESEGRFRAIFESAFEGIVIHENGVILDANPAFEKMYRYQLSQLVGMPILHLTAKESRDLVLQKFRSASQETYEAVALRKDGTTFRAEVIARQRMYKGRRVRVVAVRDVTERRQAEQALRESEERWRSLAENAPDIIMTVDADSTILFANRVVPGLAIESVIGTSLYDYVPPEHRDRQRTALEEVFETGEPQSYEIAGTGPGGHTSWYFSRIGPVVQGGKVVAAILITTDITEQRRAEEALEESEERYRTLVEAAPDAMVVHGDEKILFVNSAGVQLFGAATPNQIIGRPIWDFVHPENLKAVRKRMRSARAKRRKLDLVEEKLIRFDGQGIDVEMAAIPVAYEGKAARQVVLRDITERKRMEEALQRTREDLDRKVDRRLQRGPSYGLTFRELTVLHLMADGKSDREIGTVLGISTLTAQKHVENIRAKMQAASRTEASVRAVREGLLD